MFKYTRHKTLSIASRFCSRYQLQDKESLALLDFQVPPFLPASHYIRVSQLACVRVPQRVRSMDFTSDGRCLVTCGDRFVKFWTMPEELHSPEGVVDEGDGDGPGCSSAPSEKRNAKGQSK